MSLMIDRWQVLQERLKAEGKKIHALFVSYALAHPNLRLQLTNAPRPPLRKLAVADTAVRLWALM